MKTTANARSVQIALRTSCAFILLTLAGCEDAAEETADIESDAEHLAPGAFPEGFFFGAATAGFQVEMGCPTLSDELCVDTQSDWYAYMTSSETVDSSSTYLNGENPAEVGPGYWELYESDYDLARDELGLNAFRIGIEWSRIFPTSTEGVEGHEALLAIADPDALATYRAMLEGLRARGLEPVVTINHYTLPLWLHDGVGCHVDFEGCSDRGWLQPERIVPEIEKYAGFLAREYGDLVDWWFTMNEPFAVVLPAYLQPSQERTNPPAVMMQSDAALTSLMAMIDAHARMVDAIRARNRYPGESEGKSAP